jgi:hypothetical protein
MEPWSVRGGSETLADSLFAGFHLRRGILQVDTLITRSNVAIAMGSGHVALFDSTATSDFRLAMRVNDLAPLRSLLGADTVAVDTATVDVRMFASGGTQRFEARALVRSLAWNEARLHRADGSIVSELHSGWRPIRTKVVASLGRLRGVGGAVREAVAQVETEGGRTRFDLTGSRDETHRLHLVGHSTQDTLGQRATLEKLDIQADSTSWALAKTATIAFRPDRLEVENFDLRSAHGRLAAEGVIDRRGRQNFRLEMKERRPRCGRGAAGSRRHRRRAGMATSRWMARPRPRGSGDIRFALTSDGQPAGVVRSTLAWNGARLNLAGGFTTPQERLDRMDGRPAPAFSRAVQDSTKAKSIQVAEATSRCGLRPPFPSMRSPRFDPRNHRRPPGNARPRRAIEGTESGGRRSEHGRGGGVVPLPGARRHVRRHRSPGRVRGDSRPLSGVLT